MKGRRNSSAVSAGVTSPTDAALKRLIQVQRLRFNYKFVRNHVSAFISVRKSLSMFYVAQILTLIIREDDLFMSENR